MEHDLHSHAEHHYLHRAGWLRAAVLGANDGVISISALIVGMASANSSVDNVLLAGGAALIASAMSMAAGEYVSVSSQTDLENADIAREMEALETNPEAELAELTEIYKQRGLSPETAKTVAIELTEADALGAHLRDELGLSDSTRANPLQAAFSSGVTFTLAGSIPLLGAALAPEGKIIAVVLIVSVLTLIALGYFGARIGGAPPWRAAARVVFWGVLAMIVTMALGNVLGLLI